MIDKLGESHGAISEGMKAVGQHLSHLHAQMGALTQAHAAHTKAVDDMRKSARGNADKVESAVKTHSETLDRATKVMAAPRTKKLSNLKTGKDGRVDFGAVRVVEE